MAQKSRRDFLKMSAGGAALRCVPPVAFSASLLAMADESGAERIVPSR